MPKGYKLTSSSGSGPKTCAFFFSDKGCRTGANCKFSHEKNATVAAAASSAASPPPSVSSSSVMSSESEDEDSDDGEIIENRAGAYASLGKNEVDIRPTPPPAAPAAAAAANPFLTAVPTEVTAQQQEALQPASTVAAASASAAAATSEKKKKKKRKKSQDGIADVVAPAAAPAAVAGMGNVFFDLGKAETQSPPKVQTNNGTAAVAAAASAVATPPIKKSKKAATSTAAVAATPTMNQKIAPPNNNFRNLQLPIASFSLPIAPPPPTTPSTTPKSPPRPPTPQHEPAPLPPPLPLPIATPAHLKWKNAVIATRSHANYANAFNYERAQQSEFTAGISTPADWITSRPHGSWCATNPAAIAIDCEMCETRDATNSNKVDTKALCRISIVNADNPTEVLLDTLVKPQWPVSNHRTWVNGITAADLENVKFTLKHAQTFMAALCSEQTVVVGHAVHNDLMALRMVHHCNADTAMLYTHVEDTDGTPSLKNLAHGVLSQREMPEVHDSVNDARVALECAQNYVDRNGIVEPIVKVYSRSSSRGRMMNNNLDANDTSTLLVHRLPPSTLPQHIVEMFLAYTCIKPKNVPSEITFSGNHGKCHVEFTTREHAELAYSCLVGEEREDKSGKKQKRVGLKGGGYVCVRKMKKGK
ncbi:hypothetical protein ACHAXR_010361 [Thalassiosira sp. AJA248-18]